MIRARRVLLGTEVSTLIAAICIERGFPNFLSPLPDHENAETFVDRLVRNGVLVRDPLVDTVLRGRSQSLSPRAVRHRFLRATGLSQSSIRQIERAQQAAILLQQGIPISDTVHEVGYFDQPHLSRSLKKWIGHTPAQILRSSAPG